MKKIIARMGDLLSNLTQNPSLIYLTITVIATVGSVVLISSMAISGKNRTTATTDRPSPSDSSDTHYVVTDPSTAPSFAPGTNTIRLTLTDPDASSLLALSLSDYLPIEESSVAFLSPNLISVKGKVNKKDVGELVDESNYSLARAALILAPNILDVEAKFTVTFSDEILMLAPQSIVINRLDITKFIPQSATDKMSEALLSLLPEDLKIKAIDITDGSIEFSLSAY